MTGSAQMIQPAAVWQTSELEEQKTFPSHGGAVLSSEVNCGYDSFRK